MNTKRWLHGCGIFVYRNKFYAMVVGGYDDTGVLSSSEFWDITTNSGWIQGKYFIYRVSHVNLII